MQRRAMCIFPEKQKTGSHAPLGFGALAQLYNTLLTALIGFEMLSTYRFQRGRSTGFYDGWVGLVYPLAGTKARSILRRFFHTVCIQLSRHSHGIFD